MAVVHLPDLLRRQAGIGGEVTTPGDTVVEVLGQLESEHPGLRGWMLDEQGRLRRHVNVFVEEQRAGLETAVGQDQALYVLASISGGMVDDPEPSITSRSAPGRESGSVRLLLGTRKGLLEMNGRRGGPVQLTARHFPGQDVDFATHDPRTGRDFAGVNHGHFGPRLFWRHIHDSEWRQAEGPAFPEDTGGALERVWSVVPGDEDGVVWAGVAPAALFRSEDNGETWELNRALWEVPGRDSWEGGAGGLALHSICPWPGHPERLAVGISAAGVWITEDRGTSWRRGGKGLVPRYLPEEARENATMLCVHAMRRAPLEPNSLYMQFHGGVYRSTDCGETWESISGGGDLPADFGFPIEIDPRDPARAYVIPLAADTDRVSAGGRLRVYATGDHGRTWHSRSEGLPQENAYLTVLRQAFCRDEHEPIGLYFGTTSGELYGTANGGGSWQQLAAQLPPILSVRTG